MSAQLSLKVGGRYNWKNQPDRLVYVGRSQSPGQSRWHQFETVGKPGEVWCEVLDSELHMIEETPSAPPADEDKWAMLARTGHLSPEVADASRDAAAHVNASRVTR